MSSLYGDIHSSKGRPSNRPRANAVLVHRDGTVFVKPLRKGSKMRLADGTLQEILLMEGLPSIRNIGQRWYAGFVDCK